jgi:energy-coupling factor transporter ATP-binding protein EcfA2
MNFLKLLGNENEIIELIANLYPTGELTLLHGVQGSGKSYSCIESLNRVGIKPIYIAVENSGGLQALQKYFLDGIKGLDAFVNKRISNIRGMVVIIDTYTRLHEILSLKYTDTEIVTLLEELTKYYHITLIIIGHTADYVSKVGVFNDNKFLPRNCAEELFLDKKIKSATKNSDAITSYNLHVQKGRGNGGSRLVVNWMRDEPKVSREVYIPSNSYYRLCGVEVIRDDIEPIIEIKPKQDNKTKLKKLRNLLIDTYNFPPELVYELNHDELLKRYNSL